MPISATAICWERGRTAIGSRPLLVILAEYTGDGTGEWPSIASLHPREYYDGLAFGTPTPPFSTSDPVNPGSLAQYFGECSSGRFTPTRAQGGGLIGPFTMGPFPQPDPGLAVTAQQVITAAGLVLVAQHEQLRVPGQVRRTSTASRPGRHLANR